MNDFVELHRLINIVLRRWWLLIGLIVIAAAAGYMISQRQTPVYEATATVLVGDITKTTNLNREDVQMSTLFAQTYADLAVRQPVMQGVVEILDLNESWEDLRKRVQVSSISNSQLIEIKAEASSPEVARSIADEIAKQLILIGPTNVGDRGDNVVQGFVRKQMEDTQIRILEGQERIEEIEAAMTGRVTPNRMMELQTEKANQERLVADLVLNFVELSNLSAQDRSPNSLSIVETAYAEKDPIRPRANLNILLGAGLGMLLALGIIFLWEYIDDAIKDTEDLSAYKKLNVLGTVGRIKGVRYSDKVVTHLEPSSPTAESYRMIRNKIRFGAGEQVRAIVVTSAEPEEGKSITAANLCVIMAQAGIRTVLVDADLRQPVQHQAFNVKLKSGLADLISAQGADINMCLKHTSVNNLRVITSGESSQNELEQLSSERIAAVLKRLAQHAEVVIIDSPPALLTADAMILSNCADGVIVVVCANKTKRRALRQTMIDLQEANANVIGCIYNQPQKENNLAAYKRHKQGFGLIRALRSLKLFHR